MAKDYIEKRETGYYLIGSCISLDSIVYAFLDGNSPQGILESYSTLTSEEVHGSLAFYLDNPTEIDAYLAEGEREFKRLREESRAKSPVFHERPRKILDSRRAVLL